VDALVTRDIVALQPDRWVSIGRQRLSGVSEEMELFTFAPEPLQPALVGEAIELPSIVKN
jgi:hypothetical protein